MGLSIVNAVFVLGFAEAFCGVVGWDSTDLGNLRTVGMVTHLVCKGTRSIGHPRGRLWHTQQ